MLDVLIINSYAGSLTVAAKQGGYKIRGSYEDEGYGLPIQKANFPDITYLEKAPWPKQDLSNTIVLAHPPCAAFSQQNNSAKAKGTDAKKFQCTVRVLEYALSNGAAALAIESVPKALEGARDLHDTAAKTHGYDIFRICQNSITFGLPQWRPRFWVIYVKSGLLSELTVAHTQTFRTVDQMMDGIPSETDPTLEADFMKQLKLLSEAFDMSSAASVMSGQLGHGGLPSLIRKFKPEMDAGQIAKAYCVGGNFMSHCMRVLDPKGFATTLLFDSWWACNGRQLTRREYKRIMGFPDNYIIPDKYGKKFREFLSRGVCPPVARWILDTIAYNLRGGVYQGSNQYLHRIQNGETLDLNVKKGDFGVE